MAEQPTTPAPAEPAPQPASISAQYDLGDTSPEPLEAPSPPRTGSQPAGPDTAPPAPARPPQARLPDGTFAPGPVHQHSRQTQRLAEDLGISADEIARTPPDMLDELVYRLNKEQLRLEREHRQQDLLQREPAPRAPAPPPGPAEDEEPDLGIEAEQYDPGLIGVIRRQAQQIRQLTQRLDQVQGFQHQRIRETVAEQCDRAFAQHEQVLGKGRGRELKPDDPHYIRRKAVLALVDQMKTGSLEDRITKAVAILYGSTPSAGPQPAQDEREWAEGGVARPTHRRSVAEPNGESKAVRTAASKMKEMGIYDEDDGKDGFLD